MNSLKNRFRILTRLNNTVKLPKLLNLTETLNVGKRPCIPDPCRQPKPCPQVHPGYKKLKEIQELYQVEDGIPVYLKMPQDKNLVIITYGLVAFGLFFSFKMFYEMILPKPAAKKPT